MTPAGVMRPILLPSVSVNQRLPSGPGVMLSGEPPAVDGSGVLGDGPAGRDAADLVAGFLGEPEVAVRSGHDPEREAVRGRNGYSVTTSRSA